MVSTGMAKAGCAPPPPEQPLQPLRALLPCSCALCRIDRISTCLFADTHVNIDDCWQLTNRTLPWEDPKARQIANPTRFPSGMKALADYIHQKQLKFGIYSARCRFTCQLFAASFSHEAVDAQQWAEWGVDYLKLDECYGSVVPPTWTGWDDKGVHPARSDGSCHDLDPSPLHRLGVMRDALNASGRAIFFSNEFPAARQNYPNSRYNATWMMETHGADMGSHANMWRISQDIGASWHSILNNIDFDEPWAKFAGPGSLNDPDMLQVGNGMTFEQDLSHFSTSPLSFTCIAVALYEWYY